MTLDELIPAVRSLPRSDKARLIQLLADDLVPLPAGSSEPPLASGDYPLWSPYGSSDAASVLLDALVADARS